MLIETFFNDLRIGLRVLIKEESFCALAVVVLALGKAFNTGLVEPLIKTFTPRELRASPEIADAALTNRFRMTFSGTSRIEIDGHAYQDDHDRPNVNFENVTDGYFAALGVTLHEGRDFNRDDADLKQPVAIVNAGFGQKYFPHQSAVGRRFRTVGNNGTLFGPWRTIIRVVADVPGIPPLSST